jgi:hypothetical protein
VSSAALTRHRISTLAQLVAADRELRILPGPTWKAAPNSATLTYPMRELEKLDYDEVTGSMWLSAGFIVDGVHAKDPYNAVVDCGLRLERRYGKRILHPQLFLPIVIRIETARIERATQARAKNLVNTYLPKLGNGWRTQHAQRLAAAAATEPTTLQEWWDVATSHVELAAHGITRPTNAALPGLERLDHSVARLVVKPNFDAILEDLDTVAQILLDSYLTFKVPPPPPTPPQEEDAPQQGAPQAGDDEDADQDEGEQADEESDDSRQGGGSTDEDADDDSDAGDADDNQADADPSDDSSGDTDADDDQDDDAQDASAEGNDEDEDADEDEDDEQANAGDADGDDAPDEGDSNDADAGNEPGPVDPRLNDAIDDLASEVSKIPSGHLDVDLLSGTVSAGGEQSPTVVDSEQATWIDYAVASRRNIEAGKTILVRYLEQTEIGEYQGGLTSGRVDRARIGDLINAISSNVFSRFAEPEDSDTDLVFLGDGSGSMTFTVNGDTLALVKQRQHALRAFVVTVVEALTQLPTVRTAFVRFDDTASVVKTLDEPWSAEMKERVLKGCYANGNTNVNAAIHEAAAMLAKSNATHKLVFIATDGEFAPGVDLTPITRLPDTDVAVFTMDTSTASAQTHVPEDHTSQVISGDIGPGLEAQLRRIYGRR